MTINHLDRLNRALEDRYHVDREVGEGGMATVYLANDLRHGRQVAIKVLRPELAAALGGDRFIREIRTTAGLRHPNILPLYDSGEHEGLLYYVMPFVEGETLRDRMDRERQLPMDEALRIADEVSDALEYAHGQGVVHRDVKPENVLLENGRAVVADFGIAQAVDASGSDKLTRTGMALGTPHYMSPEQAEGGEVDARADLYALGCLLYEMLAGSPPFDGPNAMAIMARHMLDPVPNITTVRPNTSPGVTQAIERALAKAPGDRFASLTEWRAAVRQPAESPKAELETAIHKPPPEPPTPLLGREDVLATATRQLSNGTRVLTVTGVGGTGKTRLAIELFRQLHGAYQGGAAFVSLASVTASEDVMLTVSTTLDIAEAHGRSALDALVTVVGDRPFLLVLDNLEQVVEAAGDIATLVSRCPGLRVIATSRRPLKIGSETELALEPLELPEQGVTESAQLEACPSVALFVQRAQKVRPGFELTPDNAVAVADICRSLDGLPLALELAAARVRILEPAALLQRLDHALDLLTSGDRDLPMRQRTLRATISWSYSLLEPDEQRLLRTLSVFHEGWTFEAMEQVCFAEEDRWRALDGLESLVEKGLVRVMGSGERYSLLETIRAFAAEQLHAGGEVDEAKNAHAAYFVDFARRVDAAIQCDGSGQVEAVDRARVENANTLAALQWLLPRARGGDPKALEEGQLLCGYLGWYWHIVGLHMVARNTVNAFMEMAEDGPPTLGRALAQFSGGMVCVNTGEMDRGIALWNGMLADGRAIGHLPTVTFALVGTGYIAVVQGRIDDAQPLLAEACELGQQEGLDFLFALGTAFDGMRLFLAGDLEGGRTKVERARAIQARIDDFEGGGLAYSFLASMTFAAGDLDEALNYYRQAETSFATVGDKPEVARVQGEMGYAALAGGDLREARHQFKRALRTFDEVGSHPGMGQALVGLAATEGAAGNSDLAVKIAAAAQVMSERAGVVVEHPMATGVGERIEALQASIPQERLADLTASGGELTPADVLAMVGE